MREYVLHRELRLAMPRDRVFAFFADASNLERITPPWLNFQIRTPLPIHMERGARIDYALRLRGFPLLWKSEITVWEPPHRFVDEQLRGPYRQWIHEHRFEPIEDGVLVVDHVRYAILGNGLVHWLVRPDVERIFAYRTSVLPGLLAAAIDRDSEPDRPRATKSTDDAGAISAEGRDGRSSENRESGRAEPASANERARTSVRPPGVSPK